MSKGRHLGVCHPEIATASVYVEEEGPAAVAGAIAGMTAVPSTKAAEGGGAETLPGAALQHRPQPKAC